MKHPRMTGYADARLKQLAAEAVQKHAPSPVRKRELAAIADTYRRTADTVQALSNRLGGPTR